MTYEPVAGLRTQVDGPVLRLTVDRPERRNALDDTVMHGLVGALEAASTDDGLRVIVLAGAGADFCAGADIVARNAPGGGKPRVGSIQRRVAVQAHRLVSLVLTVQLPVVCVVRGWAAGIGLQLAAAADFTLVATTARLWEPFVARGFTPDSGATWLLLRRVGTVRARELLLLGRELTGTEAADWGLVHGAVDEQQLDAEAAALVERLAAAPTVAVGLTKWLLHEAGGLDFERHLPNEALALELASRSADFREGLAAFQEKRAPRFGGR